MSCHAYRSDGRGVVHILRQIDGVVPRVVVVRQAAAAGTDTHVIDAVSPQHRLRRLSTGKTSAVLDGAVPSKVPADLDLGPKRQQKHRNQQNTIDVVSQKGAVTARVDIGINRHNIPRLY